MGCKNGKLLLKAAREGDVQRAERLIAKGADVNCIDKKSTRTPLHEAALARHAAMVRLLLGKGANPNALDRTGSTPLHCAAMVGDKDVAEALVGDKRTDVTAKTKGGETAVALAVLAGQKEITETMLLRVPGALSQFVPGTHEDAGEECVQQ